MLASILVSDRKKDTKIFFGNVASLGPLAPRMNPRVDPEAAGDPPPVKSTALDFLSAPCNVQKSVEAQSVVLGTLLNRMTT